MWALLFFTLDAGLLARSKFRLKFSSNQFHALYTCEISTATSWQTNCSK